MKKTLLSFALLSSIVGFAQKFEQLARTPPMGWNSWNTFQTKISEQLVMQTADKLVSSGMRDAGYIYLVLDDGWMSMRRDSVTGDLIADPEKFPHGMKAVADYVHSKGLKFGLYNCAGDKDMCRLPGNKGIRIPGCPILCFGRDRLPEIRLVLCRRDQRQGSVCDDEQGDPDGRTACGL